MSFVVGEREAVLVVHSAANSLTNPADLPQVLLQCHDQQEGLLLSWTLSFPLSLLSIGP